MPARSRTRARAQEVERAFKELVEENAGNEKYIMQLEMMKEGLMQFIVVLVLVITTFTFIGMMLFGDQLKVFADPGMAVDTIMGYTIGSSDSSELYDVDATSFLILYVPFVFIMLFFVLPLTIAIIMDGYSEMQVCSCAVRESVSFPVSVPVSAKVAESVCKHVSVSPQL